MSQPSPAQAVWNHRHFLAQQANRFRELVQVIHQVSEDRIPDMSLPQWTSLLAFVLEYEPDLIIELGRDFGNSTCCFLEAASHLRSPCRVVSLCRSGLWSEKAAPKLELHCSPEWFARGTILQGDFTTIDFKPY